ncbi:MAG: hypothetical protein GQE15_36405 [Archangiaceae bacterium]|nr:hypothetical protein [Archangiaceae bacterium]
MTVTPETPTENDPGRLAPARPATAVRFPLAVGGTSLVAQALTLTFGGMTLALATLTLVSWQPPMNDPRVLGGGLFALGALLCGFITVVQGRNARAAAPSDLWLDTEGLTVTGGPLDGYRCAWSALSGSGAETESSGSGSTPIWHLTLLHGTEGRVPIAVVTDTGDVRSIRAACAAISAIVSGRRQTAAAPTIERVPIRCPSCGSQAPLADEAEVACGYCQARVPVPPELREQARAAATLEARRAPTRARLERMSQQPDARRVTRGLVALGVVGLVSFVVAWGFIAMERLASRAWGTPDTFCLLAPFGVVGLLTVAARLAVSDRLALRVLTLGFGALAPERAGAAQRCRRCHAPLPSAATLRLEHCGYCDTDNLTGPALDVAQVPGDAAESLELTVARLEHERRRWRFTGVLVALATLGWAAVSWVMGH